MGSKVSSKMASASRVVQAVRPHAPLIKFPDRKGLPRANVHEALKIVAASAPLPGSSLSSQPAISSSSRPPGPVSRLPGTPDSIATVRDFPQRYRRKVIAVEEMDYIQRGGPE
ncbi:alpha-ketoglutarate dehydrogenase component 4 [Denticeps clupeoides]|uniref:Mitochondrial ribosomal protein S36 n=1 Tax=Denticeps clupeoides TaxID=299321 RepID=A0AAY4DSZ6_9TELE|nr:28S ribosomal protein S36, mitochondrial [Denticeps clupeoides]